MTTMTIDIVSDVACPWCAIGYARLQQALNSLPDLDADIQWRAFELNPDPDATPQAITPALSQKYGMPESKVREWQRQMMDIAAELNINFDKMEQRFTCNTFDAHRLLKWAQTQQKQTALKLALFEAYFGQAKSVDDHLVLLECVEQAELDTQQAKSILESDQFAQAVREEEHTYQSAGVSSVPAFIIDQQFLISGAQEPANLVSALQDIIAKRDS